MNEKQSEQIRANISPAYKTRFERACAKLKVKPSTVGTALIECFAEQWEANGDKIIWPPKFLLHGQPQTTAAPLVVPLKPEFAPAEPLHVSPAEPLVVPIGEAPARPSTVAASSSRVVTGRRAATRPGPRK